MERFVLPAFKQRIVLAVCVVIGGLCWLSIRGPVAAMDASSGITLGDAQVGVIPAVALAVLAGLPAILLGVLAAGLGSSLSGVFVVSASLAFLAAAGGGSAGYFWRADLPGGFLGLALGLAGWYLLHALVVLVTLNVRPILRERFGGLASPTVEAPLWPEQGRGVSSLSGLAVTAALGALLTNLMVRSTDGGQVVGGLVLAFALAAMLAKIMVADTSAAAVLAAPLVVGMGGYLWVYLGGKYPTEARVLEAWYTDELPGVALALPIHYASAAVAGCCVGWGIGQGFDTARSHHGVEAG